MMSSKSDAPAYTDYPPPATGVWSNNQGQTTFNSTNESHNDNVSLIKIDKFKETPSNYQPTDNIWNSRNEVIHAMDYQQVHFEDVMKQPNSPLTIPGINTFFSLAFTYTQAAIYTMLTLITGIIFTVVWGIVFAVTSYVTIWVLKPVLRLILDIVTPIGAINRFFVRTFLDPMFGSIGQMFAYLRGQFGLNVSGISREPTRASVQNV